MNKLKIIPILLSIQVLFFINLSYAQTHNYPNKIIRIVIPYPTGGSADGLMRPIAKRMSEILGQPVIIDNRVGANGIIGADAVAKSPPDGYTILMGAIGPNSVAALMQQLPYDPVKDFAPLAFLAAVSNVLVVNASSSIKSVPDLIQQAKAKPGQLTYGSTGNGSSNHLAAELLKLSSGLDITHVPYKGGAAMQTDLIGGHISILFDNLPAALSQIRSGVFRPIAVTSLKRQADIPDVPTMDELGFSKFETGAWYGLFLPAGTPKNIIDQINSVVNKSISEAALRDRFRSQGFDLNPMTADQFSEFVSTETLKWRKVIYSAGIKPQ